MIPLIQSFGHLEYFLKLQQYRHLREVDEFPQAICPSRDEPFKLVTQIIDQVMAMFPDSKYLHIGCDEVYHIGMCDRCKNKDHDDLFLTHGILLLFVIYYLKLISPFFKFKKFQVMLKVATKLYRLFGMIC